MRKTWKFGEGADTFRYVDDVFRGTDAPREASGRWGQHYGPDRSGALAVNLGGRDADGTSGGWQTAFTLRDDDHLTLTFRVRITQDGPRERDDLSQVLVAVDGRMHGVTTHDYAASVKGGDASGWQTIAVDVGSLGAGRHTLTIGGFSSGDADTRDRTTVTFDDVTLSDKAPLARFEARVLDLVNQVRTRHNLDPFVNDLRLNDAAEDWSRAMAKRDIFEHSKGPSQIEKQGYDWTNWGENIAAGYDSPEDVVKAWLKSPGHRANILNPDFEEIGIGYYHLKSDGGDAPFHHYWTQEFGTASDSLI